MVPVFMQYVATPKMRATYMKATNPSTGVPFTENEADYWGTISQIDMAVGRVRALLSKHGVAASTWVSITADNGPEVNPAGGQGTGIVLDNVCFVGNVQKELLRFLRNSS